MSDYTLSDAGEAAMAEHDEATRLRAELTALRADLATAVRGWTVANARAAYWEANREAQRAVCEYLNAREMGDDDLTIDELRTEHRHADAAVNSARTRLTELGAKP